MGDYSNPGRRSTKVWRILFLFLVLWLVTTQITWRVADRRLVEEVESPPPEWFPVVIFTGDGAESLPYGLVSSYVATHPDYTFLAPLGQEASIEMKLAESLRKRGAPHVAKIKVTQLAPGRQMLEVGYYEDGEMVTLYEATDKEIHPRTIRQHGPLFSFMVYASSFALSLIIFGVGYGLIKLFKVAVSPPQRASH